MLLLETTVAMAEDDLSKVLSLFKKDNDIFIQSAISPTEWSQHWSSVREAMALSISRIHFGHYRVQSSNPTLSALRCSLINLLI